MENFVSMAVDSYLNRGKQMNYAASDTEKILREEAIALNGGSDRLDRRAIRDGKCSGLFSKIEEVITIAREEGFKGTEFFNNLIDYRNVAKGDNIDFIVKEQMYYMVSAVSAGNQGLRRQRLNGVKTVTPPMVTYGVRVYDELDRVLAGRISMSEMIDAVVRSQNQKRLETCYTLFNSINADNDAKIVTGTYDEQKLIDLVADTELEAGAAAVITGTKKALSKIKLDDVASASDAARNDKYNGVHFGSFHGTPVVGYSNLYLTGTKTKAMDDNAIYVYAGGEKPIKFVTRGDTIIDMRSGTDNADMTQEYAAWEEFGAVLLSAKGFGKYTLST